MTINLPEFIPVLPYPDRRWATMIPGRYPNFKIHGTLGHAKAAITTSRALYYTARHYSAALYHRIRVEDAEMWSRVFIREAREYSVNDLRELARQLKDLKG